MIAGPYVVTVGDYPDTDAELDTGLISGIILDVGVRITLDGGSSMDVAINTKGESSLVQNILTLANATADAWYRPRAVMHDTAGAELTGQYNGGISVHDKINIAVTGAGAGDQLEVWFMVL